MVSASCGSIFSARRPADNPGPIVRINPYELSVNDENLDFMNKLYPSVGKEVDKFWWSGKLYNFTTLRVSTADGFV